MRSRRLVWRSHERLVWDGPRNQKRAGAGRKTRGGAECVFPTCWGKYNVGIWFSVRICTRIWACVTFFYFGWRRVFGDDLHDETRHLHVAVIYPKLSALQDGVRDPARFGGERARDIEPHLRIRYEST